MKEAMETHGYLLSKMKKLLEAVVAELVPIE